MSTPTSKLLSTGCRAYTTTSIYRFGIKTLQGFNLLQHSVLMCSARKDSLAP